MLDLEKTEPSKAVIAIGPHNSCIILFAHGSMLECELSEISNLPDELGFDYPEGLGYGIHIWIGESVYTPDDDGGECEHHCKTVRDPTRSELYEVWDNCSPWPTTWPMEIL
jgi:hypothetical protein